MSVAPRGNACGEYRRRKRGARSGRGDTRRRDVRGREARSHGRCRVGADEEPHRGQEGGGSTPPEDDRPDLRRG